MTAEPIARRPLVCQSDRLSWGATMHHFDEATRCSFCGKRQDQVRKVSVGTEVAAICEECVDLCVEILDEDLGEDWRHGQRAPDQGGGFGRDRRPDRGVCP